MLKKLNSCKGLAVTHKAWPLDVSEFQFWLGESAADLNQGCPRHHEQRAPVSGRRLQIAPQSMYTMHKQYMLHLSSLFLAALLHSQALVDVQVNQTLRRTHPCMTTCFQPLQRSPGRGVLQFSIIRDKIDLYEYLRKAWHDLVLCMVQHYPETQVQLGLSWSQTHTYLNKM
jgi:hypothetical protein